MNNLDLLGSINIGIEEDRYPHLKQMKIKPLKYQEFSNKKTRVAVFYSITKDSVNYDELYERFLDVSEEVIRIGL